MSKRKRKGKMREDRFTVLDAIEATEMQMPYIDGFACGHGVHGDTSYNRSRSKREWRRYERAAESGGQ